MRLFFGTLVHASPQHARVRARAHLIVAGLGTLAANAGFAQTGIAPSYIDAMAPYEVRSMTGALAPSNGTSTMRSVTPSAWLTTDPGTIGINGVIIAWSGGAKGVGSKLIVHGGGHSDSANNGLYVFDFAGTDRPTGWDNPLVISPLGDVRTSGSTYADGKPKAVHTYDGAVYAGHNNHVYRFGGSQYDNGFMMNAAFKFNMATRTWTQVPNYPGQAGGAKTLYDPASGNIFVTMNDVTGGYFYRTANDSWSSAKSYGGDGFPFNSGGAWDTKRNRGIIVGDGELGLLSINFSNESVALTTFSPSGSTAIFSSSGISAVYDDVRDAYWLFGGPTNSSGWTTVYEMNANGSPWTVTAHSLTGDAISRDSGMLGSWGRFIFMRQWRAIGVIASDSSPAYVVKLPGEPTPGPSPPGNVAAE